MLKNYDDLSPTAIDFLKEIGNIGSGNAASALSQMLGKTIKMRVPDVGVLDYQAVIDEMGGPEKVTTGILVLTHGDLEGMIMFLLDDSFAQVVLSTFLGKLDVNVLQIKDDQTDFSAVVEMGNIMAGSYLKALSSLTGMVIDMDVPAMTVDMMGAIMNAPMIEFSEVGDKVLFINDGFEIDNISIKSNIIMIPTVESLNLLMKKLGVSDE